MDFGADLDPTSPPCGNLVRLCLCVLGPNMRLGAFESIYSIILAFSKVKLREVGAKTVAL